MTRLARRSLLGAGALLPLVGCGAASEPASTHAAASPPSPSDSLPTRGLQGGVQLIGNAFPAIQHLAQVAESCTRPGFKVAFKLTPQARSETELAFAAGGVSPFDAAVVSMGVFSNLYSQRQLFPMTELVAKHGQRFGLEERMLVRVDGEVMAIAFMQNTQNLYLRQDLFQRHGLTIPVTYADMLKAAAVIRAREPDVVHPIAQGFAKGFDAATEFTNILASLGGRFFEPGSAQPAFQGEAGVQAIETMRSVLPYMTPNALASNADDVMNQLQQGKAAMGVLWASRASRMDDPVASKVVGKMHFAAAPAARLGGPSAAHLWWDGVVMPRNGRGQRESVFLVLMAMLGEASMRAGNDLAIWVRSAYQPGRFGTGVAVAQAAGAPIWPGEPFFSLAHAEVGKVLADALSGQRTPQAALAGAAAAYARSAADKGYLKAGA